MQSCMILQKSFYNMIIAAEVKNFIIINAENFENA